MNVRKLKGLLLLWVAMGLWVAIGSQVVLANPRPVEPPATEPASNATGSEPLRLVFVGDIMLDNGPGHWVSLGKDPFQRCASLLEDADLTIGNLECVLGRGGEIQVKPFVFRGSSQSPVFLRKYFDAVGLANNHTLDFGPKGLVGMLEVLEDEGIPYFGAGRNRKESRKPLILERRGYRVALLGFNEFYSDSYAAGKNRPGNNPLESATLLRDIERCRNELQCPIVIPFLHWGEELEVQPRDDQRELARRCIQAGATAVIGAHPHVTQTVDYFDGRPVVYSLGNFVFDYYPGDPETWVGWVAELVIRDEKKVDLILHSVTMDPQGIPSIIKPE